MKILFNITIAVCAIGLCLSCSGDDNGEGNNENEQGEPGSVSLVFPENNSECTEGQTQNNLESIITFQWQEGQNADSYEVNIRNLEINSSTTVNANTNEVSVSLLKNTPYEWFVVSISNDSDESPSSAKWQFYNAGTGVENYAPFPAAAVSPTRGQTIPAAASVTLEWNGSDVDNDVEEFEVFFGTAPDPNTSIAITSQNSTTTNISSGQTYYWRVKTIDVVGNTSQSEVFDFRVQ